MTNLNDPEVRRRIVRQRKSSQTGSIQLRDGVYSLRYRVRVADGKWKTIRETLPSGTTEAEAQETLAQLMIQVNAGNNQKWRRPLYRDKSRAKTLLNAILMPRRLHGFIYCIQSDLTGNIKIGYTSKPLSRFSSYRTHSSEPQTIIGIWFGSRADETALHHRFGELHVDGEWFKPSAALLAFITESSMV